MSVIDKDGVIVLGNDSVTPANNITIKTPAIPDGSVEIYRGVPGNLGTKIGRITQNGTPAFKLVKSNPQTFPSGTAVKITFDSEDLDTHGWVANNRFTPKLPGWYSLSLTVRLFTNAAGSNGGVYLYKSGALTERADSFTTSTSSSSYGSFNLNVLEYFNGTTDYAELWASCVAANPYLSVGTSFSGFLVRES